MDKQKRREKWLREYPAYKSAYDYVRKTTGDENVTRDKEIVELRVKYRWTYEAIADKYAITRERVRQILVSEGVGGRITGLRNKKSMANKVVKMVVFFSEEQARALESLMSADMVEKSDRSTYMALLVGAEFRRREGKRAVGRPRNSDKGEIDDVEAIDYTEDIPKNIPYFGRMIGKREYADIQELSNAFKSGL